MKIISTSINLEKLESARFKTKQGTDCLLIPLNQKGIFVGDKGVYLNTNTAINDEPDQFGNDCGMWISQTEEERKEKANRTYLGNGKVLFDSGNRNPEAGAESVKAEVVSQEEDDDLPF